MKQSRAMSITETGTNLVLGLIISWSFTYYALPILFGIAPTAGQAVSISAWYFCLSGIRLYIVRRIFNS